MAITRVQTFTVGTKSGGTGSQVTKAYTSVPTAGNLLVAWLSNGDGGGDISISSFNDDIGDSVSWTAMATNPVPWGGAGNNNYRGYWKVVGTPSGGGKTVQCTIAGTQAMSLFVAEYGVDSGSPTWSITGTPVGTGATSAGPANAGNITTAVADAVITCFSGTDIDPTNAGTSYTRQATSTVWAGDAVEDRIVSATGTYAADWTNPVSTVTYWAAMGIAFGATVGSGATGDPAASSSRFTTSRHTFGTRR